METTITLEAAGYTVRTDTGICQSEFDTLDEAMTYANGLIDGYNAAVRKLAKAMPVRVNWAELRKKQEEK